ncbi:hypothetical protein C9374_008682 [Naegleria lovaniensis]|uniref:Cation-transporting ATPase n=1 Tax=Naegleria lovaniensis TaxID=51637 RepID=A0AA88GJ77_NAELO|nr:uncharacterized protein C9374_008682 [Naegleria lovaniensis]KAG2378060.1 hypothetical protein C9374_008682 [Naegleria lovaniensis]
MGKNQNTSSEDGSAFNLSKRESKKYLMADTSLQSIELNDDENTSGGLYHRITNQGKDSTVTSSVDDGVTYEAIMAKYTVSQKASDNMDKDAMASQKDLDEIHTMVYCKPLKFNWFLFFLYYLLAVCSLGLLLLLSRWYVWLRDRMIHWECSNAEADIVLIKSSTGALTTCKVKKHDLSSHSNGSQETSIRIFTYRYVKYIYDVTEDKFKRLQFNTSLPYTTIHNEMSSGLSSQTRKLRRILFGKNLIDIPVKNIVSLLLDEVLHPFYIFQIISVIIWLADEYWSYSCCIIVSAVCSIIFSLIETRRNLMKLRNMAHYTCELERVNKVGSTENVSSEELVPGDVIVLSDGILLPCDVLLLSGQCILNEAMLTGESIPVVKTPLPNEGSANYSVDADKSNTLYSGTHIVQTRKMGDEKVLGMVCRTGFDTAKGKLMLSILFPKPSSFKFYRDSLNFIGVMFIIGMIGILYSIVKLALSGVPWDNIVLRALDVITITVPPALPVAMTTGMSFAVARLKKSKIFCISPQRVNVAGMIKLMCFDKTGTITTEGLDLYGVRPMEGDEFSELITEECVANDFSDYANLSEKKKLILYSMASCHSLTYVNFELVGDPLEVKIFEATKWKLKEPKASDYMFESVIPTVVHPPHHNHHKQELSEVEVQEIDITNLPFELGILKKFEFKSSLQRMSVIVKNLQDSKTYGFVKGSPEMMQKLCIPETLPANYSKVLYEYAHKGYRVISVGYRELSQPWKALQKASREEIECDLTFIGFICMQNKLKPDSKKVIHSLSNAGIKSVMVTGDNAFTAISVSRQCGIAHSIGKVFLGELKETDYGSSNQQYIDWKDVDGEDRLDPETLLPENPNVGYDYELAITGSVFERLVKEHTFKLEMTGSTKYVNVEKPSVFHRMLLMCKIFARFTPDQKMRLVEEFQKLEYFVGMCGDGANDAGALKAAHVGVSLSEAEASIAAPFTSLKPTIACVPQVIKEGKAALATSFQMFKFMMCYSLIQFFTVVLLYDINSNLGDNQFLWVDGLVIFTMALLMGRTGANKKLVKNKPSASLVSREVFVSMGFQFFLSVIFQLVMLDNLKKQGFFTPLDPEPETKKNIRCFETTVMFIMSTFQTYNTGMAYSISKPFKRSVYTNKLYFFLLIILFIVCSYTILFPDVNLRWFLYLKSVPFYYRVTIFGCVLFHMLLSYLFERFFILGPGVRWLRMISIRPIITFVNRLRGNNKPISRKKRLYGKLKETIRKPAMSNLNTSQLMEHEAIKKTSSLIFQDSPNVELV